MVGDVVMKIENLRYFLTVARTGNVKRAAEESFLTHQNLHVILKNIEADLGMPLFTRTNKGTVLNPDGEAFVETAQQIIALYDDFIEQHKATEKMFLELHTTPVMFGMVKNLMEIIADDGHILSIQIFNLNELFDMLINNQKGIYLLPINNHMAISQLIEKKDKIVLAQDEFAVTVCHKTHSLAQVKTCDSEQIAQYPIIATGYKKKTKHRISNNDIESCKNMMRKQGYLYQTTALLYEKNFTEQDEWIILEKSNDYRTEYTMFINLPDEKQKKIAQRVILPELQKYFKKINEYR